MSALASAEFLAIVDSGAGATAKVKTVTVFYVSHDVSLAHMRCSTPILVRLYD